MNKERNSKIKKVRNIILIVIAAAVLLSAVIIGMCLLNERPGLQTIAAYQNSFTAAVIDIEEDGGVEILPDEDADLKTGIVFYVGAQITPDAYIPLLARLAEQGYSCFIPDLTCNMAALEPNAAEEIMNTHSEIASWYLAGHSMGGLTASGFACDHADEVKGLILLAAYLNRDMSNLNIPVLAIFGDTDGVMNKALYDKRMPWNPSDFEEYVIPGANHAQFGDYGRQPRDNDALISAEDQQKQTADIMAGWLDRHEGVGERNEQ